MAGVKGRSGGVRPGAGRPRKDGTKAQPRVCMVGPPKPRVHQSLCAECGDAFSYRLLPKPGRAQLKRFCDTCEMVGTGAQRARAANCVACGSEFTFFHTRGRPPKYCGEHCAKLADARLVSEMANCATCGGQFHPRRYQDQKFCSLSCRRFPHMRKYESRQEARSAHYHRRRTRKRGAGYERFTRREIFERDGYVCHLCGILTDPGDRYAQPTLDHVTPLARGGTHSRENVRCAHWICNSRKGTTNKAGLILFDFAPETLKAA